MSVDERLRIGLSRNAQSYVPEVEVLLCAALDRSRRDRRLRWVWATAGVVAAACAALVVALSLGWRSDGDAPLVPADRATTNDPLLGRYAADVPVQQAAPGTAGRWVLDFGTQGVLGVTAPPAYPGVVSGVLYALVEDELRTDMFSQDLCSGQPLGRYAMTRTGEGFTLTRVVDPCASRAAVLTATRWTAEPASSPTATSGPTGIPGAIPDGTYARVITAAELTKRGLHLRPDQVTANYLDDGSVRIVLKMQGARWSILLQDDAGAYEVGDLGTTTYDSAGRWVQRSDSTGDALLLDWSIKEDTLVTSGLDAPGGAPAPEDGERLFLEGTWTRQH